MAVNKGRFESGQTVDFEDEALKHQYIDVGSITAANIQNFFSQIVTELQKAYVPNDSYGLWKGVKQGSFTVTGQYYKVNNTRIIITCFASSGYADCPVYSVAYESGTLRVFQLTTTAV